MSLLPLLIKSILCLFLMGWSDSFTHQAIPLPENKISVPKPEIKCLAATMYYEAGNQGEVGQYLVAHVVVNRMRAYEKDACEVVKQDGQFSWLSSRKRIPNVNRKFDKMAEKILLQYYTGTYKDKTRGSLYFVTREVYRQITWKKPSKIIHRDHVFF